MKILVPSTSRSDVRNTDALRAEVLRQGHDLVHEPSADAVAILLGDRTEMVSVARVCIEHHCRWVHVGAGCETRGSWDQIARDMLTAGCAKAWSYTEHAAYKIDHETIDGTDDYGVPILDTLRPRNLTRADYVLVALNPVTAHRISEEMLLKDMIADACRALHLPVVWSSPNEDPQSHALHESMEATWPGAKLAIPFGDALEKCRVIVGNSSAALIEAPVLGTPFVDCGCRQQGRPLHQMLYGEHIIDGIKNATPCALKSPYKHPERKACESIIRLCEEVNSEQG